MERVKLWIDTDLGGDIDDAFALSLALHSPEIDLRGISTVYLGNPWRVGLIRNMLRAYGRREIPVIPGAERPLLGRWGQEKPEALANDAPLALVQALRREPDMVVAAIGPLTNVALALLIAPDIAAGLTLYIMGGAFLQDQPEWNIRCDPEAARVVFESGARITLVGLDVTRPCTLARTEAQVLVQGPGEELRCLRGELQRFLDHFDFDPVLHDPLTLAALLWEELFSFEFHRVSVETEGPGRGATLQTSRQDAPGIRVAVSVDVAAAMGRMCARIRERDGQRT